MSDDLSPRDAVDRFLARRETDAAERTLHSYEARLDHFVEWCEEQEIERVNASPEIIRRHYDKASELEAFEERRREASAALDITEDDHE